MCKPRLDEDSLAGDFICLAMGSVADLCVIPIQDYLGLGSEARINYPLDAWRQLGVENEERAV